MKVSEKDTKLNLTPWGRAVKIRLAERDISQNDVLVHLKSKGYTMNKQAFSQLLRGFYATTKKAEIVEINKYLGISFL